LKWDKIPFITKYSHFTFEKGKPGYVLCKTSLHDEGELFLMGFIDDEILITDPAYEEFSTGLPPERQDYLFEKIRDFCTPATKDIVCPRPPHYTEKKKRGRPKKISEQISEVNQITQSTERNEQRRPGRPKKQEGTPNEGTVNGVTQSTSSAERDEQWKYGRSKKQEGISNGRSVNEVNQSISSVEPDIKRKRGRPPKQEGISNERSLNVVTQSAQSAKPDVKQKRGRPRKHDEFPEGSNEDSQTAGPVDENMKKRGRPKKENQSQFPNGNFINSQGETSNNQRDDLSEDQKRIRRPIMKLNL